MKRAKVMERSKKQLKASGIAYDDQGRYLAMHISGMLCFLTPYSGYLEFSAAYPACLKGGNSEENKAFLFDLTEGILCGKFEIKESSSKIYPAFQVTVPAELIDKPKKLRKIIAIVLSTASSCKKNIGEILETDD